MPPTDRLVPRFAAEPPQEGFPYGRWAETLQAEFLAACLRAAEEADDLDVGEPTDITWFPDRTWEARTWIPMPPHSSWSRGSSPHSPKKSSP